MTSEFDTIQRLIGLVRAGDSMALDLLALWVDEVHELAHDVARGKFQVRQTDHFFSEYASLREVYEMIRKYLTEVEAGA